MLVTMKALLDKANAENYAVAAPNIWTEVDCRACIDAAVEMEAPLIIDIAYAAHPNMLFLGRMAHELAKEASVPIAINLDHGENIEQVMMAIQAGFTSVMIDRSSSPFEKNVEDTKEIVRIAHAAGLSVESELGHVGMADADASNVQSTLSDPLEAKKFVELTGVDALAIAIGTAHGAYPRGQKPHLDFERLAAIKAMTKVPLVMHGSSGTPKEELRKACTLGINKVNIANDLCQAVCLTVKQSDFEGNRAYAFYDVVYNAVKIKLKEMILIYGSKEKAIEAIR